MAPPVCARHAWMADEPRRRQCPAPGSSMPDRAPPPDRVPAPPAPASANDPPMSQPQVHIPLAEYLALTSKPSASSSTWSFTQGLLLGQFSVILLIILFIKFFIFSPAPPLPSRSLSPSFSTSRHPKKLPKKRSQILRPPPPSTTRSILAKTLYNVHAHQPESLDWFNVLIAQTLAQVREEARADDALLASLDRVLNGPQKPPFLDKIVVTEVSLGEDFPIFSNCRITPSDGVDGITDGDGGFPGKLQARMDVDLSDVLTLGIETRLLLNWPRPLVAVLPVALSVSILRFSGTLSISFVPTTPENNGTGSTMLAFSFCDDYRLDISVRSLLGGRSRLTDVPKIAQLVESRLHQWVDERCVEPRFQQIVLPSLWPRRKTTREGVAGREGAEVGAGSASGSSGGSASASGAEGAAGTASASASARRRGGTVPI